MGHLQQFVPQSPLDSKRPWSAPSNSVSGDAKQQQIDAAFKNSAPNMAERRAFR
jgi:hypothetical protein